MKRHIYLFLTFFLIVSTASAESIESIIASCPEKAGGIYYAYDVESDTIPVVPEGYHPVYISHYGRHGSRWPVKQKIYKEANDFFQQQQIAQNLTDDGKGVWKLVGLCAGHANGHLGELSPLGVRQHQAIATRMAERFPTLFKEGSKVVARSSVEPRCIMSMMAFCDRLRDIQPNLFMTKSASPGDMDFIHHKSEEADIMGSEQAPWMWEFHDMRDALSACPGLASRLFKTVPSSDSVASFMRNIYDIAISVQNLDSLDADLLSLFSPEELTGLWKAANYIQYNGNGMSPLTGHTGPECARALISEIVDSADEALNSNATSVYLRFGHDTDLLRLVSLLDIDNYGMELNNPDEVAENWQNFSISPMGANIQFVFFRNDAGSVLVAPRLNERPVKISDVPEAFPGLYDWNLLSTHLRTL